MIRRKASEHGNHERWLVSYADFITLLFAFFVVMFASTQSDKNKAKDVSDSVRQALEHGQFSAAISTVLGRGKHEARKAPLSKESTTEKENPTPPPSPVRHPPDLAQSLDTLMKELDADLKNGKLELKLDARGKLLAWAAIVAAYLLVMAWIVPVALQLTTDQERMVRIGIALVAIMPLGFLLGFAFPTGMRLVEAIDWQPTPWFWGINGATGVLASVLGVMVGMSLGIGVTLVVSAACYLLLIPTSFALLEMGRRRA